MIEAIKQVFTAVVDSLELLFIYDMDTDERERVRIMNHPEDRKKLFNACDNINKGSNSETIVLSTGRELTINPSWR